MTGTGANAEKGDRGEDPSPASDIPENFAEYCVKHDEEVIVRESIHPTALCLLQMRDQGVIFVPSHGNVSMMKPENAAEILDGLLGGALDSKPHIVTGQPLDANKMQIMTTYARVSEDFINSLGSLMSNTNTCTSFIFSFRLSNWILMEVNTYQSMTAMRKSRILIFSN